MQADNSGGEHDYDRIRALPQALGDVEVHCDDLIHGQAGHFGDLHGCTEAVGRQARRVGVPHSDEFGNSTVASLVAQVHKKSTLATSRLQRQRSTRRLSDPERRISSKITNLRYRFGGVRR